MKCRLTVSTGTEAASCFRLECLMFLCQQIGVQLVPRICSAMLLPSFYLSIWSNFVRAEDGSPLCPSSRDYSFCIYAGPVRRSHILPICNHLVRSEAWRQLNFATAGQIHEPISSRVGASNGLEALFPSAETRSLY